MADQVISVHSEMTAGYDSNPAQSDEGPGLAFANYAMDASRQWPLAGSDLTLGVSGWYRDYEADNDSYRLTALADWALETGEGAGLVTVLVAGVAYRDALVPADERDEAAIGVRYRRTLSARDTLNLSGEMRRLAYQNASLPWAGRPGSGSGSGQGVSGYSERGRGGIAVRRTDDLSGLGLGVTHHWSYRLSTDFSLAYARCDSPVQADAYRRYGLGLLLRLEPSEHWHLEVGLGWSRTRYDQAPRQQEREDLQLNAGLAVRRSLTWSGSTRGELYCGLDWLDSDSTIDSRSFRQQVTQCGLAWSFR